MKLLCSMLLAKLPNSWAAMLLVCCLLHSPGCKWGDPELEEGQIIGIAEQALVQQGWEKLLRGDIGGDAVAGYWEVTYWRIPYTPGSHAIVRVSDSGEVLAVKHGVAQPEIDEEEAIALALEELAPRARGGLLLGRTRDAVELYVEDVRLEVDGHWAGLWKVFVKWWPATSGSHADVMISTDGKVVCVYTGI